jgi:hypothetical protein
MCEPQVTAIGCGGAYDISSSESTAGAAGRTGAAASAGGAAAAGCARTGGGIAAGAAGCSAIISVLRSMELVLR